MNLNDFIAKYNGQKIDYDGSFPGQCVDICKAWQDNLGLPTTSGNAIDWPKNYDSNHYVWVANTITGVPQAGDIVCWGTKLGKYGHVGVFHHGNVFGFTSFDQNFPLGSPCHLQSHNYTGVLGWLRPILTQTLPSIPNTTTMNLSILKGHVFNARRMDNEPMVTVDLQLPSPEVAAELGVDLGTVKSLPNIAGIDVTNQNDVYNYMLQVRAERDQALQERDAALALLAQKYETPT